MCQSQQTWRLITLQVTFAHIVAVFLVDPGWSLCTVIACHNRYCDHGKGLSVSLNQEHALSCFTIQTCIFKALKSSWSIDRRTRASIASSVACLTTVIGFNEEVLRGSPSAAFRHEANNCFARHAFCSRAASLVWRGAVFSICSVENQQCFYWIQLSSGVLNVS